MGAGGIVKSGGGTATLTGQYGATGLTHVQEGRLHAGDVGQLVGEFRVDMGAELDVTEQNAFAESARLSGDGTVVGSLNYPGAIAPGDSIGKLTVAGNLTLASESVVELELDSLNPVAMYDQLQITGTAILDGTLNVLLGSGFSPIAGDSFALIMASQITQQFASVTLPQLDAGLNWDLTYLSSEVLLSVSAAPIFAAADFNNDGHVDAADLSIWQTNVGLAPAAHGDGDADGDGTVDGADFLTWQRQMTGPASAAAVAAFVPEPTSWQACLAAFACLAASLNLNRQRPRS
jgi:hypothetical protein